MGVPGLTTFIDKNNQILSDSKLRNIKIIVDGNNLLFHIYYRYRIDVKYGGEYYSFYDCCKHFFEPFTQCSINLFVVFDGAYEKDGRKFKTVLQRDRRKIIDKINIAKGNKVYSQIRPLFAPKIFNQVLNELGIAKVTCLNEADQCIASLAKEWNCPIMSDDSDFFIYDIPAGLILTNYLNLNVKCDNQGSYINVPIYFINTFKKWAKFKDNDMALFATLLGNDLIDSTQFDTFFARKSCIFGRKAEKIKGLLNWLASKPTTDSAISEVLTCINVQKKQKVKSIIEQSIREYNEPKKSYVNRHFIDGHTIDDCPCFNTLKETVHYLTPPLGFLLINHDISSDLLELMINFRKRASCQIEHAKEVASQECSLSLRRVLYGSIANTINNGSLNVLEYKRVGANLAKDIVTPLFENAAGTIAYNFHEILNLSIFDRQMYVVECMVGTLKIPINKIDDYLFYTSVVCYWNNTVKPNRVTLQAILLLLFTQTKPKKLNQYTDTKFKIKENIKLDFSQSICNQDIWNNFSKKNFKIVNNSNKYTYKYCQFQSCFKCADDLNSILLKPFDVDIFINGSFLLSLCNYLEVNGDDGFACLLNVFKDIKEQINIALRFLKIHSIIDKVSSNITKPLKSIYVNRRKH